MTLHSHFTLHPLITDINGEIDTPITPLMFAVQMSAKVGKQFNRIARVWFDDPVLLQQQIGNRQTAYDHLILGLQDENDLLLSLWVDKGHDGMVIAMCRQSELVTKFATEYLQTAGINKPDEQLIDEIFQYIFENPATIDILQKDPSRPAVQFNRLLDHIKH